MAELVVATTSHTRLLGRNERCRMRALQAQEFMYALLSASSLPV